MDNSNLAIRANRKFQLGIRKFAVVGERERGGEGGEGANGRTNILLKLHGLLRKHCGDARNERIAICR